MTSSNKWALGIDIGSSSVRCSAIHLSGNVSSGITTLTARRSSSLDVSTGTLDPHKVLALVMETIEEVTQDLRTKCVRDDERAQITDVVTACIAMSLVGVSTETGEAITPVLTYANREPGATNAVHEVMKNMKQQQQQDLSSSSSSSPSSSYHDRTGAPLHPAYAPSQIHSTLHSTSTTSCNICWTSLPSYIISRLLSKPLAKRNRDDADGNGCDDDPSASSSRASSSTSSLQTTSLRPLHAREVGMSASEASWAGLLNLSAYAIDEDVLDAACGSSINRAFTTVSPVRNDGFHINCAAAAEDAISGSCCIITPRYASCFFPFSHHGEEEKGKSSGVPSRLPLAATIPPIRFWLGVGDGAAAAAGSGAMDNPILSLTVGTSAALRTVISRERALEILCLGDHTSINASSTSSASTDHKTLGDNHAFRCSVCNKYRLSSLGLWAYQITEDHVLIGGALTDGGSLVEYFTSVFGAPIPTITSTTTNTTTPVPVAPPSAGLLCLPFWSGERATGWNSDAKGVLYGLQYSHTPLHALYASMEGVAFRVRAMKERLMLVVMDTKATSTTGISTTTSSSSSSLSTTTTTTGEWRIVGSGAAMTEEDSVFPQILADILQMKITVATTTAPPPHPPLLPNMSTADTATTSSPSSPPSSFSTTFSADTVPVIPLEATTLGALLLCARTCTGSSSVQQEQASSTSTSSAAAGGVEWVDELRNGVAVAASLNTNSTFTYEPNTHMSTLYEDVYKRHCLLYEALAPLHSTLK